MLKNILEWNNLIFVVPLIFGIIMAIGAMTGLDSHHHPADLDGDGIPDDVDPDVEGHGGFLSALGFGRCPIFITLSTMCFLFGGTGIILNTLSGNTKVFFLPIFIAALAIMYTGTKLVASLVAKYLPSLETKSVTSAHVVGSVGTLIVDSDDKSGAGDFRIDGDIYRFSVITSDGPLPKGTQVIITDTISPQHYVVCRDSSNDI